MEEGCLKFFEMNPYEFFCFINLIESYLLKKVY